MIDILIRLDEELDRTPSDHYVCKPLPRSVVAAAAAEIRRLRVQTELQRMKLDALTYAPDETR